MSPDEFMAYAREVASGEIYTVFFKGMYLPVGPVEFQAICDRAAAAVCEALSDALAAGTNEGPTQNAEAEKPHRNSYLR